MAGTKRAATYIGNKGGEATKAERLAHCERCRWTCPYCLCDLHTTKVAIDHVVPQYAGGVKSSKNQIACCVPCNSSKQHKSLADFAARKGDAEIIRRVQRALRRKLDVKAAKEVLKGVN